MDNIQDKLDDDLNIGDINDINELFDILENLDKNKKQGVYNGIKSPKWIKR